MPDKKFKGIHPRTLMDSIMHQVALVQHNKQLQVRVRISDVMVASGSSSGTLEDNESAFSDCEDDDLSDLSDTDPEDEWDWQSSLAI